MALLRQDWKIAYRNGFFFITIIVALLYVALVRWVLPIGGETQPVPLGVYDRTEGRVWETWLADQPEQFQLYDSEETLVNAIQGKKALGLVIGEEGWTVYRQGYESNRDIAFLVSSINVLSKTMSGQLNREKVSILTLEEEAPIETLVTQMVPLLMATDIILLGFFFAAAMVFNEKKENSLTALRVSPLPAAPYLLSKITVNVGFSLIFSILFLFLTGFFSAHSLELFAIILLSSFAMSGIGVFLGCFYSSISDFIYPAFIVTLVCMIPGLLPLLSDIGINLPVSLVEWIPSYHVFRETHHLLFQPGESQAFRAVVVLAIESVAIFGLCVWAYRRRYFRLGPSSKMALTKGETV